jgi:N6-L-threonylcarbamoyladenine synthase
VTRILAIETSCDETAVAVVDDGVSVLSSIVVSQEALHRRWGGVVPELASREHAVHLAPAVRRALAIAGTEWSALDAVAVTRGPGLAGALVVGLNFARAAAVGRGIPLVTVNHLEAHLHACWLASPMAPPTGHTPDFPVVGLVVSGGHTELVVMHDWDVVEVVGRTRDDAAGEAFDKVARILGLGYPGGPAIQAAAALAPPTSSGSGEPDGRGTLTRPWMRGNLDFSFSGLKTAMLRQVEGELHGYGAPVGNPSRLAEVARSVGQSAGDGAGRPVTERTARLARAFQEAVVDVLVSKTCEAAVIYGAREVVLAGGVAANLRLREALVAASPVRVRVPALEYCTDNAAMVGAVAYRHLVRGEVSGHGLDIRPNLRIGER